MTLSLPIENDNLNGTALLIMIGMPHPPVLNPPIFITGGLDTDLDVTVLVTERVVTPIPV